LLVVHDHLEVALRTSELKNPNDRKAGQRLVIFEGISNGGVAMFYGHQSHSPRPARSTAGSFLLVILPSYEGFNLAFIGFGGRL
jgi:hypothetical protein